MDKSRTSWGALAPALVPGVGVGLYWVLSLAQGDSLSLAAIYRHGDYTYFPALAGLANFSLGESLVYEHLGEGIRSFPLPALALHGLAIGLLGPVGFPVADVLIATFAYLAARRVFRACALLPLTSEVLALLVSCSVVAWSPSGPVIEWLPKHMLWGYRLPRPFVTDLFLLLAVGSSLLVFVRGRRSTAEWLTLGLWFGLLLQSRFYSAATLGLGIGVALLGLLTTRDHEIARTLRGIGAFALATSVAMIPFLVQRLSEHPDIPVRFGSFPVDRLEPLLLEIVSPDVVQPLVAVFAVGIAIWFFAPPDTTARLRAIGALGVLCLISPFALPASTMLLGQTVQPYQFEIQVVVFKTLAMMACAGQLLDVAATQLAKRAPALAAKRAWRPTALAIVAIVGIGASVERHAIQLSRPHHVRTDFIGYRMPMYRESFEELTRELAKESYRDARVLATFDIQVHAWWSLFGGGQAYLPDPFATNVPDEEIEDRLLSFLKMHGVDRRRTLQLLQNRLVQIFFLACAKYQASPAHTFAPLDEYPPRVRQALASMSVFQNWRVWIPESEALRLLEKYDRLPGTLQGRRLDVIVLGRGKLDGQLEPDPAEFQKSYANRVFRVYTGVHR